MRFIKEYANYKKSEINNAVINQEEKQKSIDVLNKVVNLQKRGLITVDESMKMISEVQIRQI